ncbi:YegP family protein [Halococcus hamelinensis]|uniref:YegP family protein n=1 Tax=Halococcus hamelinensis TaxID=332168 RepID=UPI0009A1DEB5|nr:DUF1508 domain-containing protein [Halococcus hamelinensis]
MSTTTKPAYFDVYKDAPNSWGWQFISINGTILAESRQDYTSEQAVLRDLRTVQANASSAPVELPDE